MISSGPSVKFEVDLLGDLAGHEQVNFKSNVTWPFRAIAGPVGSIQACNLPTSRDTKAPRGVCSPCMKGLCEHTYAHQSVGLHKTALLPPGSTLLDVSLRVSMHASHARVQSGMFRIDLSANRHCSNLLGIGRNPIGRPCLHIFGNLLGILSEFSNSC